MWEDVFETARPGLRSGEADLARAEAELSFALPASFKAFARTLGAGRIGGAVRVYTPVPVAAADLAPRSHLIAHAVATAIDGLAGDEPHRFTVEGEADAALMERACFFGETEGGAFAFFDVVPGADEYEVWVLGADLETVRYGGADLEAFARGLLGGAILHILGGDSAPLPSTFDGDDAEALAALGRPAAPA